MGLHFNDYFSAIVGKTGPLHQYVTIDGFIYFLFIGILREVFDGNQGKIIDFDIVYPPVCGIAFYQYIPKSAVF